MIAQSWSLSSCSQFLRLLWVGYYRLPKWSHCNYSLHAWEGTFSEVIWRAQWNEKKKKKYIDWQAKNGKYLSVWAIKHLCHMTGVWLFFPADYIITVINSRKSFSDSHYYVYGKMNFSLVHLECHGVFGNNDWQHCNLWKAFCAFIFHFFIIIVVIASPANRTVSKMTYHTTAIYNQSSQTKNNQSGKGDFHSI